MGEDSYNSRPDFLQMLKLDPAYEGREEERKQYAKDIYEVLTEISDSKVDKLNRRRKSHGLLVLLGNFYGAEINYEQMKLKNPVDKYLSLKDNKTELKDFLVENESVDGAFLVHYTGQLLYGGIIVPQKKGILKPGEGGTGHRAAASESTLDRIIAAFKLSGDTGQVSMFHKGSTIELEEFL